MKQISILGCGWLGLPLAKSLLKKGFSIKGSTTSLEKVSVLNEVGITVFQIEVSESTIIGNFQEFIENSEILIIDIPPKLRGNQSENFVKKIENIIPFVEKASVEKVVFISSTSVYPDDLLEEGIQNLITEDTKPQPDSVSGKQLLVVENLLLHNSNFKTTIIRFGGLIGEKRHPIHFLAGKKDIQNPHAPINLIHQNDCIGIIEKIIEKNIWKETFNAVSSFHPTRKEHYTQKAIELNLSKPEFENSKINFGKTICSSKIETVLNYQFKEKQL